MPWGGLSPSRLRAMLVKEFVQMRRDRLTFAMMVVMPILQLLLFGYAINTDPKHLPTVISIADNSPYARSIVQALRHSGYFDIKGEVTQAREIDRMLGSGEAQFVVTLPEDLTRKIERGEVPTILVEADATDPSATGNAVAALQQIAQTALNHDVPKLRAGEVATKSLIELRAHRRYNPEAISSRNIVPGLIGVVLTMTMVIMTALAMTRERERGTMETLLAMPLKPFEVMVGKIAPYVLVGYVQVTLILTLARFLFDIPLGGDLILLSLVLIIFITANLAIGFTFSTIAENQLQAMQMSFFFMLPSILLSGFMFPFRGMPIWAQFIGECLPATHFMRVVRGLLLKGNGWVETWPDMWPLLIILTVVTMIAMRRYRVTLD